MGKLGAVAAMVVAAAWLASTAEILGMVVRGAIQTGITADTVPAIVYGSMWFAMAATPAWVVVAPIPIIFVLAIKAHAKKPLTGAFGYAVIGVVLGLLYVVPISELMTHWMIAVEDGGSTPASDRWLFETPYIVLGSVAAWLGLWWFERGRKRTSVG